jgi:hypothetical protein
MKMTHEWYDAVVPTGFPVLWYPHGIIDDTAVPFVAFVTKGWTKGICDLAVLPSQDGTVQEQAQVFHAGDPRLRDSYGRLSPGAHARGCWVPACYVELPSVAPGVEKKKIPAKQTA